MIKNSKLVLLIIILSPIFLNFLLNIFTAGFNQYFYKLNLFDVFFTLFLFLFLYEIGKLIKKTLILNSISISIVLYLYSFLTVEILLMIFINTIKSSQVFVIVNALWFAAFIYRNLLKHVYRPVLVLLFLNICFKLLNNFLTKNRNIIGDVEAYLFSHSRAIYENSFYFSLNTTNILGYPQYSNYFDSVFFRIINFQGEYNYFSITSNVIFFLTLLFIYELNIKNELKIVLASLFSVVIINNEFIQFLLTSSLMAEGYISLFSIIVFYNILEYKKNTNTQNIFNFVLLGMLYLTKQFLILIVVVLFLYFSLKPETRKYSLFSIFGFLIQEIIYRFGYTTPTKSHHLSQIDIEDTIQDLLTNSNLKLENILLILQNLFRDKPLSYLFILAIISFIFFKSVSLRFHEKIDLLFFVIFINYICVFTLYISAWRYMELESPIRFFINFFHIQLILPFLITDKLFYQENKLL